MRRALLALAEAAIEIPLIVVLFLANAAFELLDALAGDER